MDPTQGNATEPPRSVQGEVTPGSAAASRDGQPSPIVSSLRKYAGTKAAVFVLDPVSDAPVTGSTISAYLSDAGWALQTCFGLNHSEVYGGWSSFATSAGEQVKPKTNTDRPWR